jgi:hypothetical protein
VRLHLRAVFTRDYVIGLRETLLHVAAPTAAKTAACWAT